MFKVIKYSKFNPIFINNNFKINNIEYKNPKIKIIKRTGCDVELVHSKSAISGNNENATQYQFIIEFKRDPGQLENLMVVETGIWKTNRGFFETHCEGILSTNFLNMGLGIEVYYQMINWALNNEYKIKSSRFCDSGFNCMTIDAQRVWESKRLRSKFKILKRKDRYHVIGRK